MYATRVLFISEARAERMIPPSAGALISITDTDKRAAILKAGWRSVLRLSFDDLDPVAFSEDSLLTLESEGLIKMAQTQAIEIARFVATVYPECRRFVVHCRFGVSRSAAVAKAIAEHLGGRFPSSYDEYNIYVYESVRVALSEYVAELQ